MQNLTILNILYKCVSIFLYNNALSLIKNKLQSILKSMPLFQKYINYILFLFTFLISAPSFASHMVGGDITYKCLGGNRYEIKFTLYQDCLSGNSAAIDADNPLQYAVYTGNNFNTFYDAGSINLLNSTYIPAEFSNDCLNNPPIVCLQKQEFITILTLPPSTTGYRIIYQRCCRNNVVLNVINSGNTGVTYYTDIPPFTNNVCSNNSPIFKNFPPQIICNNYPFIYDFSATDADGDSLTYRLCNAYPGGSVNDAIPSGPNIRMPNSSINYAPPYSALNPISASPELSIDPVTGIMTGTPTRSGRFVVSVCVDEWRNGRIINSLSRDIQLTITDCSKSVVANMPSWGDERQLYTLKCDNLTVNFKNTSSGGFSYLWRFGVNNATSTEAEPTFTYPDTGTYYVTLIVNPGTTCVDSITKQVKLYNGFDADFDINGPLCPEQTINFEGVIVNEAHNPAISYQWYFENQLHDTALNTTYSFPKPGGLKNVLFVAKSQLGCIDSTLKIIPIDSISIKTSEDTIIVLGYDFSLKVNTNEEVIWSPTNYIDDPQSKNPKFDFPDTGIYTYVVSAISKSGCINTDTINITVVKNPQMYLPNAFTPNGDGLNDVFRPTIVGYSIINTFEVYNRYGQLVYKAANNNNPGWDGTYNERPADVGVYYYRITYTSPMSDERQELNGDVTLLR
jgi:gliding motility-associated-like protein